MQTRCSFAIAGLTQFELRIVQQLIDVMRSSPETAESIVMWLEGNNEDASPNPAPRGSVLDHTSCLSSKTAWFGMKAP